MPTTRKATAERAPPLEARTRRAPRRPRKHVDVPGERPAEQTANPDAARLFFELDPQAGVVATGEGIIMECNPAFARLFGFASAEAARGKSLHDLEGIAGQLHVAADRLRDGEVIHGDVFQMRRQDGQPVWIRVAISGTLDKSGELQAVCGYLLDVTRSHERDVALEENLELMRFIEAATQDVLWEWDVTRGTLKWNDGGPRRFRYTPEEMRTSIEWHCDRIHPEDRDEVLRNFHAVLSGLETSWKAEYRFLRGDGSYTGVLDRVYIVRGERGEPLRVIGWMQDVSRWRQAEDLQRFFGEVSALLDSQIDFRAAIAAVASAAVPSVADRCIIDLVRDDGSLERAICHPHDPTARRWSLDELAAIGGKEWPVSATETVLSRREPLLFHASPESGGLRDSRSRAVHSVMAVPIYGPEGTLGVLTLLSLNTCRHFMPVDLLTAKEVAVRIAMAIIQGRRYETAQRASSDREQILRLVAHDLRNPLQALAQSLELVRDPSFGNPSKGRRWLEIAQHAAKQMEHLLGDLVDVSSIEAGHFKVEPQSADPRHLFDTAVDLLEPLAEAKRLHVEEDIEDDLPPVRVDTHQFLRVLSNLIGNAAKFTPEGGTVRLRARRRGDEVEFAVSDTGPGIPPEDVPQVFAQFWSGDRMGRRGTGLGLAIAKGIVEAHGGRIWAESEMGNGTTFLIALPSEESRAEERKSSSAAAVA